MTALGWIGSLLLSACGVPQAVQAVRQGHARGLSLGFLWMWGAGEVLTFAYILGFQVLSWPLVANYLVNTLMVGLLLRYRYWPRENS